MTNETWKETNDMAARCCGIETAKHTPTPWIVDDRHIHPQSGLTYPPGQEPETDVIVQVDTDCHESGLLNATDKANLQFIVRAVNSHEELIEQRKELIKSLETMLASCGMAESQSWQSREEHECWLASQQARAALAKAKGDK